MNTETRQTSRPGGLVAVITRTKNRGLLLRRALISVANQTLGNYLHVIVNDGGDPAEVAQALTALTPREQAKVVVLHHPDSKGMEAAANTGIGACDSEFIVIHDDDDTWDPQFLEKTTAAIGAAQGIVSHSYVVHEEIRDSTARALRRKRHSPRQITLFKMAMARFQFPNLSFLFRRSAFEKVGPFNEELPVMGDWDFNLRFLTLFDIEVLPEPLAYYHHRVANSDAYGNSVNAGEERIWRYRSILANALLRRDLEHGRMGLGLLVNVGVEIREIQERLALFDFANPFLVATLDFFRRALSFSSEREALAELSNSWLRQAPPPSDGS